MTVEEGSSSSNYFNLEPKSKGNSESKSLQLGRTAARGCQVESYRRPTGGQANVVCAGNGNKLCTRVEAAKRKSASHRVSLAAFRGEPEIVVAGAVSQQVGAVNGANRSGKKYKKYQKERASKE